MNDSQRQQAGMDPPQGREIHTDRCNDDTPKDLSIKTKKLKQIPPPLNLMTKQHDTINMLKDSAIIATSPKSPLMQKNLPFRKRAYSFSGVNDAATKPMLPPTPTAVTDGGGNSEVPPSPSCLPASSQSSPGILQPPSPSLRVLQPPDPVRPIAVLPALPPHTIGMLDSSALLSPAPSSLGSSQEELNYSPSWISSGFALPWPCPAWHCFLPGTRIRIDQLNNGHWQQVDDMITSPSAWSAEWLAPLQLDTVHLIRNAEEIDAPAPTLSLQFSYVTLPPVRLARPWEGGVTAECEPHHPFYVQDKGWCAICPDLVMQKYNIPCKGLERGDICLPATSFPTFPIMSPDICERFKRFSFPPEETSTLHQSTNMPPPVSLPQMPPPEGLLSPPSSPNKKALDALRPKRPMNAFMLFAKKYRLDLIQRYPGKDNRAISVLLGEAWRSLPASEREVYVQDAKVMAQEQKRLHPDCWKRKRSHSTSSLQTQQLSPQQQ